MYSNQGNYGSSYYMYQGPLLLDESQFEKLKSKVNSKSFADQKYKKVTKFIPKTGRLITSEQAKEIVRLFSFDNDQIKVAKFLYTHLYDKQNYDEMLSVLSFSNSKKEVEDYIESLGPQNNQYMYPNQGMYQYPLLSQDEFDKWIDKIRQEFPEREKLKKLTVLAQSKFFTASQAREFVKLFSFADDQKSACVLLYPKLVDKENYDDMLDGLTFSLHKKDVEKAMGL